MGESDSAGRITTLERQLADLMARLPPHSTPPAMMAELDALEEALATARRLWQAEQGDAANAPGGGAS